MVTSSPKIVNAQHFGGEKNLTRDFLKYGISSFCLKGADNDGMWGWGGGEFPKTVRTKARNSLTSFSPAEFFPPPCLCLGLRHRSGPSQAVGHEGRQSLAIPSPPPHFWRSWLCAASDPGTPPTSCPAFRPLQSACYISW